MITGVYQPLHKSQAGLAALSALVCFTDVMCINAMIIFLSKPTPY